jgi:RNA polymerase sigma-70 factor (ECF subfamily)
VAPVFHPGEEPPLAEDREFWQACRRRDRNALGRLVDTQYDRLYGFLLRLTGAPELAAELTQEAFVRALERLDSWDGRARFSTWLHAIALNLWRDAGRRAARERAAQERVTVGYEAEPWSLSARLEAEEVRQAVARLPEGPRVAILLYYYQEMSYQEIAHVCRRPVGTVASWIHRGLRTLRVELTPEQDAAARSSLPRCRAVRDAEGSA